MNRFTQKDVTFSPGTGQLKSHIPSELMCNRKAQPSTGQDRQPFQLLIDVEPANCINALKEVRNGRMAAGERGVWPQQKLQCTQVYMRSQTLVGCFGKRAPHNMIGKSENRTAGRNQRKTILDHPRLHPFSCQSFGIKTFFHTAVNLTASNCIQPRLQNANMSNIPQSNVHSILHLGRACPLHVPTWLGTSDTGSTWLSRPCEAAELPLSPQSVSGPPAAVLGIGSL